MQRGLWMPALLAAALSVAAQGQGASAFDKAERDAIAEMCTANHAACGAPCEKNLRDVRGSCQSRCDIALVICLSTIGPSGLADAGHHANFSPIVQRASWPVSVGE